MAGSKYEDMTLEQLQDEAARRGVSKSGNKPDIRERLEAKDAEGGSGQQAQTSSGSEPSNNLGVTGQGNTTNAPDVSDRQTRQADQEINRDPQTGNVQAQESENAGIEEGSDQNLGAETTQADPAGDDTPRGDVGDQYPEHGSIGLTDTGRGKDHAEILQGLSDERRSQQLAAAGQQGDSDGDGQPDNG